MKAKEKRWSKVRAFWRENKTRVVDTVVILGTIAVMSVIWAGAHHSYRVRTCSNAGEYIGAFDVCAKAPPGSICIIGIEDVKAYREAHYKLRSKTCDWRK